MKEVQKTVDQWAQTLATPYWQPLENLARLSEEVGELARELNIRYGAKKRKPVEETKEVEDEMGDIIFTLACIANSIGLDLQKGFDHSMEKCYGRDKELHEKK